MPELQPEHPEFLTSLESWQKVKAEIARAAVSCGRSAGEVALVCVTKTHPVEAIRPLLAAGQRIFGENRVQEAQAKWPALRAEFPDLELHLIGPLQSNKVEAAVELFDVIETLDRPKLAQALAAEFKKSPRRPKLYVQVNTGAEPQKAGVLPPDLDGFLADCAALGLKIEGLMCIPPVDEQASPHFAFLKQMAGRHGIKILSMGMSADFELAIQLGATHVRVGSAIFGARPKLA
jgi:pyridoxal phosphate enzyme (YggS family)